MFDSLRQDIRYAVRNLQKQRGYSFIIIITLALGIGGTTAVFSVVNAVLIRPLPYKSPEQLVTIWNRYEKMNMTRASNSPPDFLDRKRESRTLENMAAIEETSLNLIGRGEPQRIRAARVTASLFPTLGISPSIGRTFREEEDQPGKSFVVIISHHLWKKQFGSRPEVIGQNLNLSGRLYTVVGVMPEAFWFPTPDIDLWVPIAFTPEQKSDSFRGNESLSMIARAKPGISLSQVRADMEAIAANVISRVPERRDFLQSAGWSSTVLPLQDLIAGEVKPALLVLLGAVTLLLLTGCANVANLILARATGRQKEFGIRVVLGARRSSLIRLLCVEAILLAMTGGTLGLALAYWTTTVLPSIAPDRLPRVGEITIDPHVLSFSLIVSLLTAVLITIVPALQASMRHPFKTLKLEGTSTPNKSMHAFRNVLVIAEITLALVLATGAALLIKSFEKLVAVDPGFKTENRMALTLSLPSTQYDESARVVNFYQQLLQEIESLPGVHETGATVSLPIAGENSTATFMIEGKQMQSGEPEPGFEYRTITPHYFRATGIPLRLGRDFDSHDTGNSLRVAIIDENLAKRYWKNQNPIGQRIGFSNSSGNIRWRQVVGVVGHVNNAGLNEEGKEQIYFPHAQLPERTMSIVVWATNDPMKLIGSIRNRVKSLDPNLPVYQITPLKQIVLGSIAQPRFNMFLFILFAATALALGAVGIYGALSYSVMQRRKEIGIRVALGARPEQVLLMIVRQSMILCIAGTMTGLVASVVLSRFLQTLLFHMRPVDPQVYAGTAGLTIFIALLASAIPAGRAARLDPLRTLREE